MANVVSSGVTNHPVFGPVNYRVTQLPVDAQGQVETTVDIMCRKVQEDSKNPIFIGWVHERINTAEHYDRIANQHNQQSLVEAVFQVAKTGIKFQRDEATGAGVGGYPESEVTEVIIRPVDMVGFVDQGIAVGDCDDFSSLVAAMLLVLGIRCSFVLVAADRRAPGEFSHVYVAAYPVGVDGIEVRTPIDASHGKYCGWEVGGVNSVQEVPATGSMSGLGGWLGLGLIGAAAWWVSRYGIPGLGR